MPTQDQAQGERKRLFLNNAQFQAIEICKESTRFWTKRKKMARKLAAREAR
jgi:hypothetical protein